MLHVMNLSRSEGIGEYLVKVLSKVRVIGVPILVEYRDGHWFSCRYDGSMCILFILR